MTEPTAVEEAWETLRMGLLDCDYDGLSHSPTCACRESREAYDAAILAEQRQQVEALATALRSAAVWVDYPCNICGSPDDTRSYCGVCGATIIGDGDFPPEAHKEGCLVPSLQPLPSHLVCR